MLFLVTHSIFIVKEAKKMKQQLTLYHGSNQIIEKPIFGYGKKNNDFGLGFYCTESEELAK